MKSDSPIYVLVVEDEFLSRLHAMNLVEDAGYKAIEASWDRPSFAKLVAARSPAINQSASPNATDIEVSRTRSRVRKSSPTAAKQSKQGVGKS